MECMVEESQKRLNVEEIIASNVELIRRGWDRKIRFPQIKELFAAELICTFSHLNPNLPIDEIYGNFVLFNIAKRLGLKEDRIINAAYDNLHPGKDAPKGYRVQYVIANPKILEPDMVLSLQEELRYERDVIFKDGQNRIKSAPEQNISEFRARFDQIDQIYQKYAGKGDVPERIIAIRRDFFTLIDLEIIPEHPFSRRLTEKIARVLELLEKEGYPFWEMPVPVKKDRYLKHTFLLEGIDARRRRQPVRFEDGFFVFTYEEGKEKKISKSGIYDALRNMEVIPTMPLVILSLVTAPQIPHLGGRLWKKYTPAHLEAQCQWLNIKEKSDTLILSTGGAKPLIAYRHNEEFTGFPAIYMTYGPKLIKDALKKGLQLRTEFKRVVY